MFKLAQKVLNRSLKTKIFSYYALLIILLFLAASVVLYVNTVSFTREWVIDYTLKSIRQSGAKIDGWFREIDALSEAVMWNQNVRNILVEPGGDAQRFHDRQEISKFLELLTIPREDVYSIFLARGDQLVYKNGSYFNPDINDSRLIREKLRLEQSPRYQQGEMVFTGPLVKEGVQQETTLLAARKLYHLYSFEEIGTLLIEIRHRLLPDLIGSLDAKGINEIYLSDADGRIIYSSVPGLEEKLLNPPYREAVLGETTLEYTRVIGDDRMLAGVRSQETGWHLLVLTPMETIMAPYQRIQRIFLIVTLAGVTIALILAAMLSRSISNPLTRLVQQMTKVRLGNLQMQRERREESDTYNELQKLHQSFHQMLDDLNRMVQEVYEARLKQQEAELGMLRAQINPHFLYNTLDIIHWQSVINGQDETGQLVRALSDLLRYNIDRSERPVTVRDELRQVKNYLKIQEARFEGSIRYEEELEDGVSGLTIQKFLLQPLVENSVKHGFGRSNSVSIRIVGRVANNRLLLDVIDNGVGMSPETLRRLNEEAESPPRDRGGTGIGVHNVRRRIRLIYGSEYDLIYRSEPGKGTTARLILPLLPQKTNPDEPNPNPPSFHETA